MKNDNCYFFFDSRVFTLLLTCFVFLHEKSPEVQNVRANIRVAKIRRQLLGSPDSFRRLVQINCGQLSAL